MIRRWMLRIGALALVPALLAACGGDDDDTEAPQPTATSADATKPAEGSATAAASASAAATSATAARTATTAASGGSSGGGKGAGCEVNITGDINATLKTKDELGAAGVFHWFTDEAKKQIGNEGAFFVLNCTENPTVGGGAKEINLNFLAANGSKEDHFPMKPAKYVISGGEGLGGAKAGEIGILFALDDTLFTPTEPGTFNITRFDKDRIVAEFSFTAEELFTTGKAKVVKVSGKLEFTCEATRVCRK